MAVQFGVTTWGRIHILVGVIAGAACFGLFSDAMWARTIAVAVAAVSILGELRLAAVLPRVGGADHSPSTCS
jgi:hypothetical protein